MESQSLCPNSGFLSASLHPKGCLPTRPPLSPLRIGKYAPDSVIGTIGGGGGGGAVAGGGGGGGGGGGITLEEVSKHNSKSHSVQGAFTWRSVVLDCEIRV